jgi:regulator of replication initiation timing
MTGSAAQGDALACSESSPALEKIIQVSAEADAASGSKNPAHLDQCTIEEAQEFSGNDAGPAAAFVGVAEDLTLHLVAENARLQALLQAHTQFAAEKEALLEKLTEVRIENARLQTLLSHVAPRQGPPEYTEPLSPSTAVEPASPRARFASDDWLRFHDDVLRDHTKREAAGPLHCEVQAKMEGPKQTLPAGFVNIAPRQAGQKSEIGITGILNEVSEFLTTSNTEHAQLASQLKQQVEKLELQLENLQLKERVAELEKQSRGEGGENGPSVPLPSVPLPSVPEVEQPAKGSGLNPDIATEN